MAVTIIYIVSIPMSYYIYIYIYIDTCLKTIQKPEAGRELKVHTKNQAIELRTFVINNDLNIGLLTKTKNWIDRCAELKQSYNTPIFILRGIIRYICI